jgi:hypothetical protein
MWARVKASQVIEIINGAKAMTIDGTQYPASIFKIWSAADLKAKGLYSYSETGHKDTFYYNIGAISYTVDDSAGTVVGTYASTPKAMDDTNWTQSEIDAGDAPTGATTSTVKTKGLKTLWKEKIKASAASLIAPYDWYSLRKAQAGTAIPSDINTYMNAVRTASAVNEANVASTANVTQMIERSQDSFNSEGVWTANSVYNEWPTPLV